MARLGSDAQFRDMAERGLWRLAINRGSIPIDEKGALRHAKMGHLLDEERRGLDQFDIGLYGTHERCAMLDKYRNAQSAVDGSQGGYLSPAGQLLPGLEIALDAYGPLRSVARVVPTELNDVGLALIDDVSEEAYFEGDQSTGFATDLTFALKRTAPKHYHTKPLLVPVPLLEDSLEATLPGIAEALGRRISRRQNREWTTQLAVGTGVASVSAASSSAISYDDIANTIGGAGAGYRTSASAAVMLNPATLTYLQKLKDGAGKPVWPEIRTLNIKWVLNPHMDSTLASGKVSLISGDWNQVVVVDNHDTHVIVMHESFAERHQIGVVAHQRSGMAIVGGATEKPLARLVH